MRLGGSHPAYFMHPAQVQNQVSARPTLGPEGVGESRPGEWSWSRPMKAQDYRTPALLRG